LVYFVAIWCILWRFGMLYQRKIWQPCSGMKKPIKILQLSFSQ
jgi:hypothetical protein